MKISKIVIAVGFFIVLTLVLGFRQEDIKLYEKQKNFSCSSEVLQQLNNKEIIRMDNGDFEENDVFECFSQKRRLTDLGIYYDKINIEEIVQLTDNQQKDIIDEYNILRKNYSERKTISKTEAVRIKVQPYFSKFDEYGQKEYIPDNEFVYLDMVLVDEGEGMVIDYINSNKG